MTSPFHAVARGLRLANVGLLLACWATVAAFVVYWLIDRVISFPRRNELRWVFIAVLFATILAGVAGVVVGIVGRVRCLRTPAEFPAVRGRAITAVILEASGWGSLLVGIAVTIAMNFSLLPDAPWVPMIGMGLSGLMMLAGRVMFLRFLLVLAAVVEDKLSDRRARYSLRLFVYNWMAGFVGVVVAVVGSVLRLNELSTPLSYLIWIGAGMVGLAGFILYDRLLNGLAKSVQAFADAHPSDEEERRYRAKVDEAEDADLQAEPAEGD